MSIFVRSLTIRRIIAVFHQSLTYERQVAVTMGCYSALLLKLACGKGEAMSDELRAKFEGRKTDLAQQGFFADLAGPLKAISYIFYALAVFVLGLVLWGMISQGHDFSTGAGVTVIVLASIGIGFRKAATFLTSGREPNLASIAFWGFAGFGTAMVLIGIVVAIDDPGGLFACAFGAVFIGIGFLARKLLNNFSDRAPDGKQAIVVSEFTVSVKGSTRSKSASIHVDQNASPEEIQLARTRWATAHWMKRPDWVAGEIIDERARTRTSPLVGFIVFPGLTLGSLVLALIFGDIWWLFTAVIGVITLIFIGAVVYEYLHHRKFADSVLALEQTPLRLGGQLRGELRTGVPMQMQSSTPYTITLQCVHRWETTRGSGDKRQTVSESHILWKQETQGDARTELTTHQRVPVALQIPDDQPETSLGESKDGNFWELLVHLPLPGLDYRVTFTLPVLHAETCVDPSVMPKTN